MDPIAVLAEASPTFSDDDAVAIAKTHYGLDVTVSTLVSERDQNFRMRSRDGREFVLKIANSAEERVATDFQIQALIHIAASIRRDGIPIRTPEIVPTAGGENHIILESPSGQHVTRVVTFLEGVPLEDCESSPGVARNQGAYLAHLGRALRGFEHPGSRHSLLWDLQRAAELRSLIRYVPETEVADCVSRALDDYEEHCSPVLPELRSQVIHSDFNPDNVLLESRDTDVVVGVIDFGDMLHAPLIADVAIGCSYQRVVDGDPLSHVAEFVAGYHGVTPLEPRELDILFELIKARVCASIAIIHWRASVRGSSDEYVENRIDGVRTAARYLNLLSEVPREHAVRLFRQIRASVGDQALS